MGKAFQKLCTQYLHGILLVMAHILIVSISEIPTSLSIHSFACTNAWNSDAFISIHLDFNTLSFWSIQIFFSSCHQYMVLLIKKQLFSKRTIILLNSNITKIWNLKLKAIIMEQYQHNWNSRENRFYEKRNLNLKQNLIKRKMKRYVGNYFDQIGIIKWKFGFEKILIITCQKKMLFKL